MTNPRRRGSAIALGAHVGQVADRLCHRRHPLVIGTAFDDCERHDPQHKANELSLSKATTVRSRRNAGLLWTYRHDLHLFRPCAVIFNPLVTWRRLNRDGKNRRRVTAVDPQLTIRSRAVQKKPGSLRHFKIIFSMDLAYAQLRRRSSDKSTENGQLPAISGVSQIYLAWTPCHRAGRSGPDSARWAVMAARTSFSSAPRLASAWTTGASRWQRRPSRKCSVPM